MPLFYFGGNAMVLKVDNLTKRYHNGRGINSISFSVDDGDIFGLLGPNGSGKTTTMKIIVGLMKPDSGSVEIFSNKIDDIQEKYLRDVGCLIEAPALYDFLSARKNLEIAASIPIIFFAITISQISRSTSGTVMISVLTYITIYVVTVIFPKAYPLSFTSYTSWYLLFIGSVIPVFNVLNIIVLFLAYSLIFFAISFWLFDKRQY